MMNKILPFLNSLLPAGLAVKGLSKVDPRMAKFLTNATAAGFGTDAALSFLRNKLGIKGAKDQENQLQAGSAEGTLRPDEGAALEGVNETNRGLDLLQKGVSVGAGLAGGIAGDNEMAQSTIEQPANFGPGSDFPGAETKIYNTTKVPANFGPGSDFPGAETKITSSVKGRPAGLQGLMDKHPELGNFLDASIRKGLSPAQAVSEAKKVKSLIPSISNVENEVGSLEEALSFFFQGSSKGRGQSGSSPGQSDLIQAMDRLTQLLGKRNG